MTWLLMCVLISVGKGQPHVNGPPLIPSLKNTQPLGGGDMHMEPFIEMPDLTSSQVDGQKTQGFKWSKSPSLTPKKSEVPHKSLNPNAVQGTSGSNVVENINELFEPSASNTAALHINANPIITEPPQENIEPLAFNKFLDTSSIINSIASNRIPESQLVTDHLEKMPQDQALMGVKSGNMIPGKLLDQQLTAAESSIGMKKQQTATDIILQHVNSVLESKGGVGNEERINSQEPSLINSQKPSLINSQEPSLIQPTKSLIKSEGKVKRTSQFHGNDILGINLLASNEQTNSILSAVRPTGNNAITQKLQTTAEPVMNFKPELNDLQSKLELLARKFKKKVSLANKASETDAFMTRQQTLSMPFQRGGRVSGNQQTSMLNPFRSLNQRSQNNNVFQPLQRPISNANPRSSNSRNNNVFQPLRGPISNTVPRFSNSRNNNVFQSFQGPINNAVSRSSNSRNNNVFQPFQGPISNADPRSSNSHNNNVFRSLQGPINNAVSRSSNSRNNNEFQPLQGPINGAVPRSSNSIPTNNNVIHPQNRRASNINALRPLNTRQENTNTFRSPNVGPMNNNDVLPPNSQTPQNENFGTSKIKANNNNVFQSQNFNQGNRNGFQPPTSELQSNSVLQNPNPTLINNNFQPSGTSIAKNLENAFRQQHGFRTNRENLQQNPTLGNTNELQTSNNQRKNDRRINEPPIRPPPVHQENFRQFPEAPISPLRGFRAVHPAPTKPEPIQTHNDIGVETAQRSRSEIPVRPVTLPWDEIQRDRDAFIPVRKTQPTESPHSFRNLEKLERPSIEKLQQLIIELNAANFLDTKSRENSFPSASFLDTQSRENSVPSTNFLETQSRENSFLDTQSRENSFPSTSFLDTKSSQMDNLHNDVTIPERNVLDQLPLNIVSLLHDALKQQQDSRIKEKRKHVVNVDTRPFSLNNRPNSLSTVRGQGFESLSTPQLVQYIADATGQDFNKLIPKLAPIYYNLYIAPQQQDNTIDQLLNKYIALKNKINLLQQFETQNLNHQGMVSVDTNSFPRVWLTGNSDMIRNQRHHPLMLQTMHTQTIL